MNMVGKVWHTLRGLVGLADPSGSHLLPSHGWLNRSPADVRQERKDVEARRSKAQERNASS